MLIFVERGGGADSLAPGKSLDWGTDALVVSANRNKVIRVTVYLASRENDQFLPRSWVDGCVKCIGLIVCPHFAHLFQISWRALGRASREICEGVRSLFVRNGVAPYNERVGQGWKWCYEAMSITKKPRTETKGRKIAESVQGLIDVLQTSFEPNVGNYHPSYFYYTTISTLSRILDNRLLRLSNIQSIRLNDFREPREFGPSKMWRRICIGCFSVDRMENNAMWSAYGRPETEAIAIRIPSRVMEELRQSPVFVDRRIKRNKFSALDEIGGIEDGLIRVLRAKCFHHDVAYFPNIITGEEDEQERKDAVIKLYRDYSECANIHVSLHGASPKELDPLAGYVKRWQWMYERESRLRVLLPKRYAGHMAYLKLPKDFFDRVGIVFGPAFDVSTPFARETLRKFLDARGKSSGNLKPFTESAYTNVLNYDRKTVGARSRSSSLLTYKGQVVSRHSPHGESLSARYLRFVRDAFEDGSH